MASDDVGSRPSRFMIIPNTKRHPNNTKTDQLPISEVITGLPRPYHNTSPPLMSCICRNMGNSGKSRFPQLDHESKMRLLKTHSHASQRPGYEARKNAKNVTEGKADTIRMQTISQNLPRTASVAGRARRQGAMARPTTVKTLPRIVGVAGGF